MGFFKKYFFEENSPVDKDKVMKIVFSGEEDWLSDISYFVVHVIKPLVGEGSLTVQLQQSSEEHAGFKDIQGLGINISVPTETVIVRYSGIITGSTKYLKYIRAVQSNTGKI